MDGTMMRTPLLTDALIERAGALFPKVEVVSRMADKSLVRHGYGEIAKRSRALAAGLARAGLRPGERVATLMWNSHAHLEAYFAIPMAGGVYHTLNLRLPPDELAYIVSHAKDRFLIVDDVLLPLWEKVAPKVKMERVFVFSLSGKPVSGHDDYESLLAGGSDGFVPPARDENDAAGLCYTSGTTGNPKGVAYSHRALVLHTLGTALVDGMALSQRDTVLPVVPMFHVNAWGIPFTATMVGAKQVHPGPHLDAKSLLELYENEGVTMSAGVPTIWLGILNALEAEPGKWKLQPGLRMVVGGSAAPESLIRGLDKHGLTVIHAWGMTETTPLGSCARVKASLQHQPEDELYRIRCLQGIPAPFVEVRARGEKGFVPWDGVSFGELEVRGPWVAASYYENDEGSDRWTDDGWFKTGDVVTIDAEGYLKIVDRAKDVVKSGGEWISSVDMENLLMGHPSVREACVVGIPDPKWGERPCAVVVLRDGQAPTDDALRAHLATKFPKWALPERIVRRAEIPKTTTGKFLKRTLRDELSKG